MRVYIVRHGESEANAKGVYQHRDVQLSETGIKQAHTVAQRFLHIPIDSIYSSSFERAKKTAYIIGDTIHKPVELLPLLTEIKRPTIIEGRKQSEPEARSIMRLIKRMWHDPQWRHSDEETFFDLRTRAIKLLHHVEQLKDTEQVLLVSHGTFIRMLVCVMIYGESVSPGKFKKYLRFLQTTNTGITVCDYVHRHWRLLTWNDQAHLGE